MNRKLQSEIDRILKKVAEGVVEFDGILKKVYSATSSNQKEKYEGDLKKEIKKLQRYRDQIKVWIASNEVKNKSPLVDCRKLIESKMEQFKVCEKETKTKPYSKEGIGQQKHDNAGVEEARSWLVKGIETLKEQLELFESELEGIPAKKKKSESERVNQLTNHIERHKFHLNALEQILRYLDNERVPADKVNELKDSVEYYIESNQDPEFYEDEGLYDTLGIKISAPGQEGHGEDDEYDDVVIDGVGSSSSSDGEKSDSETEDNVSVGSVGSVSSATSAPAPTPAAAASAASRKKGESPIPASTPIANPVPVRALSSSKDNVNTSQPIPVAAAHATAEKQTQQRGKPGRNQQDAPVPVAVAKPAPAVVHPPAVVPQFAAVAAGTAAPMPTAVPSPHRGMPFTAVPSSPQRVPMAAPTTGALNLSQTLGKGDEVVIPTEHHNRHPIQQPIQQPTQVAGRGRPFAQPVQPSSSLAAKHSYLQQQFNQLGVLKEDEDTRQPTHHVAQDVGVAMDAMDVKNTETFDPRTHVFTPGTLAELSSATLSRMAAAAQQPTSQEIDNLSNMMLEASFKNIPESIDTERPRQYTPRNSFPTPNYYPQVPLPVFESPQLFEKFDTDTLFFIFYYQQGSYQQYLAARELKKQSWRYHKKYLTWFQRHEEPKEITNDYEQGTYVYFDYETGWCQRKKTEFTFEYRYLEE